MTEVVVQEAYPKPAPLTTATIPEALKEYDHWVVWRYQKRNGKQTKVPYSARTGAHASATDSRTWASFDEAVIAYAERRCDGIGFVLSSADPFVGLDLDGCRDPETGELEPWATAIVAELDGYTEASPSGEGVHIIVEGKLPHGAANRYKRLEVYQQERFFTVTGRVL